MIYLLSINKLRVVEIFVNEIGSSSSSSILQQGSTSSVSVPILESFNDMDLMIHDEIQNDAPVLAVDQWRDISLCVNQEFSGGVVEFRNCLVKYSISHGFNFKYVRNAKKRIIAVCKKKESVGCSWRIHASADSGGYFYVRIFDSTHTCGAGVMSRTNKRLSSSIIAEELYEKIHSNPLYRPIDVVKDFSKRYGCDITYSNAWTAVEKAKGKLYGDYFLSYDQTLHYIEAARVSNPNSHIVLESDPDSNRFKRMFVSFYTCIVGFNYCRPMLFLDGTFLTGRFRGQLLFATAKDGNQGLFPLAYAIVDSENVDNWTWFMEQLLVILNPDREITFISDRHKGLLEAVSKIFPSSPHGYCTLHLKNNLRTHMSGKLSEYREPILKIFDKLTYAATPERYEKNLAELKKHGGPRVAAFINSILPEHYSHAFFKGNRYGEVTSNAAESINNMFRKERQLPILGLVDRIRTKIMEDMAKKRDSAKDWNHELCPNILKKVVQKVTFGRSWTVIKASDDIFEVRALKTVMVNIKLQTCTCFGWQVNQFPCTHALSALQQSGNVFSQFIDKYFHVDAYRNAYALPIFPVSTLNMTLSTKDSAKVLPPVSKRQPGRKRTKRIPSTGERKKQYKCGRCGQLGHNKKGCQERVEESL